MRKVLAIALLAGCAHGRAARQGEPVPSEATPVAAPVATPDAIPTATKERRSTGSISRAALVAVLDAAPPLFLQHVDSEPRFVGGKFRGWKLASFFPGDARFSAVDLQAGDVVLNINSMPIENPDQFMRVWDSLRTQRVLVVVIERDGQVRELRYDIHE